MTRPPGMDRATKSDIAYEALRRAIIVGEVVPNESLDEAALARRHGLGRTPCREALKRLTLEHFVVWPARRSPYVRGLSALETARLHELRLTLETQAAQLAAARVTVTQIVHLESVVAEMTGHIESRRIYELVRCDEAVHRAIAVASDNRFLAEAVTQLNLGALRLWYDAMSRQDISEVAADHRLIVEAIKAREPQRACDEMSNHIHQNYDRQLALLRLPGSGNTAPMLAEGLPVAPS